MPTKDWTGNTQSTFVNLGASNHSPNERATHDFYATDPKAVKLLLELEDFKNNPIWECACGNGHLSEEMKRLDYEVFSSDLIQRAYKMDKIIDFLADDTALPLKNMHIITNPPYKYTFEFMQKAISLLENGKKLALFLPIRYLSGKKRKLFFEKIPPKNVYISSGRIACAINGDFEANSNSAIEFMWLVWQKGYQGKTFVEWFN
jgi:hypothetical protein